MAQKTVQRKADLERLEKDASLTYENPILAAVHETMEGLYEIGLVGGVKMQEFDEACLTPVESFDPAAIRALRMREDASQTVFARHLGIAPSTLERWERGDEAPTGIGLRMLALIREKGLGHLA